MANIIKILENLCESLKKKSCYETTEKKKIVFEDNSITLTIDNFTDNQEQRKKVCKVRVDSYPKARVDSYLIDDNNTKKCDYLFAIEKIENIFLLELKSRIKTEVLKQFDGVQNFLKDHDIHQEITRILVYKSATTEVQILREKGIKFFKSSNNPIKMSTFMKKLKMR